MKTNEQVLLARRQNAIDSLFMDEIKKAKTNLEVCRIKAEMGHWTVATAEMKAELSLIQLLSDLGLHGVVNSYESVLKKTRF